MYADFIYRQFCGYGHPPSLYSHPIYINIIVVVLLSEVRVSLVLAQRHVLGAASASSQYLRSRVPHDSSADLNWVSFASY